MLIAKIVVIAATTLSIEFSVKNTSNERIYVFDRVFERTLTGEPVVKPELAYRSLLDDGVLLVEKAMQRIPVGIKAELAEIPYLTALEPSQVLNGKILLELPIREFHAYLSAPEGPNNLPVKRVLFRIGYLRAGDIKPDMAVVMPDPDGKKNVFAAHYGYALLLQRFMEADLGHPPKNTYVTRERDDAGD
jgi:hypothetical protein